MKKLLSVILAVAIFLCAFNVSAFAQNNGVITAGETKTVDIKYEGEVCYFSFTPDIDGVYIFSSDCDSDTYARLYDSNRNELLSDDDSGRNNNFSIKYNFQAGETYVFSCKYLSEYDTGSFDVSLVENQISGISYTPAKPIEIVEYTNGEWNYNDNDEQYFRYYDPWFSHGDIFIVNYANGLCDSYTFNDNYDSFISDNGVHMPGSLLNRYSNQYAVPWTPDSANYFTIEYMALKTQIPVTIIENHEHKFAVSETEEVTCTKDGYTVHTCECGYSYRSDLVKSAGHNFGDNEPTCAVCKTANPSYIAPLSETLTEQSTAVTKQKAPTGAAKVNGEWIAKKQKNTKIKKLTNAKKSFKISWSKITSVTGYQIQYSTSSKFTKKTTKTVTIKKNKTTSTTIKKLKSKKKYYVRIRTYKNVKFNGKTVKVYSSWTKAKTVKTK